MQRIFEGLGSRFLVGSIATFILTFVLSFSYTPLLSILVFMLVAAVAAMALREYYEIAKKKGLVPREKTGVAFAIFYVGSVFFSVRAPGFELLPLAIIAIAMVSSFCAYFIEGKNPLENIAITLFGILYLAIPMGCTLKINYFFPINDLQEGRAWLIYLLIITYLTDSCGLFFGKTFGKRKLAPLISPNKTWAGAVGAFFCALLAGLLFAYCANHPLITWLPLKMGYVESLFLSGGLSILAQLGDLSESLLKRDVGVKDSSKIPGLGGMLDVIDSLIFTAPFLYLYLSFYHAS